MTFGVTPMGVAVLTPTVGRWRGWESNPRHHDFQSCALPTELPRPARPRGPADGKASDRGIEGLIAFGRGADSCSTGTGRVGGPRGGGRIRGVLVGPEHAAGAARAPAPLPDDRRPRCRRAYRRGRRLRGHRRPAGSGPGRAGVDRQSPRSTGGGHRAGEHRDRSVGGRRRRAAAAALARRLGPPGLCAGHQRVAHDGPVRTRPRHDRVRDKRLRAGLCEPAWRRGGRAAGCDRIPFAGGHLQPQPDLGRGPGAPGRREGATDRRRRDGRRSALDRAGAAAR